MILKLLFMLDLWLGVGDINNAKHVKEKYKQQINTSSSSCSNSSTSSWMLFQQKGGIGAYQKMRKKK